MYNALRKSNIPVEFVELRQEDHFLSRKENRQSVAHALLRFLDEHLDKPQQHLLKRSVHRSSRSARCQKRVDPCLHICANVHVEKAVVVNVVVALAEGPAAVIR